MIGDPYPDIGPISVTEPGVQKLLLNIVESKSSGPDNIPNRLLKELAIELAPILTSLFNQSLAEGAVPLDWTNANIAPIYKKEDKHLASNYRPVSLTCVCSKLLEHIVVKHIMDHLDHHTILTDLQHGFRRNRSCTTQLLMTVADLDSYHDSNIQVDINILDFSKAFDVVSHRKLLAKIGHYGIRGNLSHWIASFLTHRTQSVVIDGTSSTSVPVLSGVPQGTCLGPVLFLCYINDITQNIKSQLRLFADDALLYRPIHSFDDHLILQEDLNALESWAKRWDMQFNPSKCFTMSAKRNGADSVFFYTIYNQILKCVATQTYLGVLFSDNLSFSNHIGKMCSKTSRTLGFLNRNLRSCPPKLRELAYTSMCRSTLEYASQIWDPYKVSDQDKIERIQRKAARFVVRDFRRHTSVTDIMRTLEWEPLTERRKKSRLTLFYQITNDIVAVPNETNPYLKQGRRGRYIQIPHKYQAFQYSFYPRTIKDWNNLKSTLESGRVFTSLFTCSLSHTTFIDPCVF